MRQELATVIGDLPGGIDGGAFQEVEEAFARVERELAVQHRLLDETTSPRACAPVPSILPQANTNRHPGGPQRGPRSDQPITADLD